MSYDPFRKCRDCRERSDCRRTRKILRRYFWSSDFPQTGAAWPWDNSLCPACVLSYPFEAQADCPVCGGEGEVAERRIRGTAAEGNQDWHDIGLQLFRLPIRQRQAVEAWIWLGEIHRWRQHDILKKLRTSRRLFRQRLCAGLMALAERLKEVSL